MIYHITTQSHWADQINSNTYAPTSYNQDQFIHCCEAHQLEGVLFRYFKGAKELLVIHLDETRLKAPLLYEPGTHDELFPHLYGVINKDAIVQIQKLQ